MAKNSKKATEITPIEKMVVFKFAHRSNADAVAIALAFGGHFVRMRTDSPFYEVEVYKHPTPNY